MPWITLEIGGKELEEMLNLKSEDKCPPVSFDPPSNEQRQQLLEIMEEVGNTGSKIKLLIFMNSIILLILSA